MKAKKYLQMLRKAIYKGNPQELLELLSPQDRSVLPDWENESESDRKEYDKLVELAMGIIYK